MDALVNKIRRGDRRSLARAMSLVDEGGRDAQWLKDRLRQSTGPLPWWGFTGPPGVGKSTLIDALLSRLRERGSRVGVVAVDPTSPRSDGALLGDRVRMMRHAVDCDVFIRSLATHGCAGGLSDATLHCARLLELAGYDPVLIETVGVGQNDADITSVADVCVVILGPGYGDDIQLIKAGLLEIADIVVVNKCDLPGADRLVAGLHAELGRRSSAASVPWRGSRKDTSFVGSAARTSSSAPIEMIELEAKSGKGVDQLLEKLLELDAAARAPEQRQRRRHRRVLREIRLSVMSACERALEHGLDTRAMKGLVAKLERGEVSLEEVVSFHLSAISTENAGNRKLKTDD